jgi:hypothetical protein
MNARAAAGVALCSASSLPPLPGHTGVARFDRDRAGQVALARIRRDVESGMATGVVRGTPTLFIDGDVGAAGARRGAT